MGFIPSGTKMSSEWPLWASVLHEESGMENRLAFRRWEIPLGFHCAHKGLVF